MVKIDTDRLRTEIRELPDDPSRAAALSSLEAVENFHKSVLAFIGQAKDHEERKSHMAQLQADHEREQQRAQQREEEAANTVAAAVAHAAAMAQETAEE